MAQSNRENNIMKMDEKAISYLEDLTYLSLGDDERKRLVTDFEVIIKSVDNINSVDTDGIIGISHPLTDTATLREDIVGNHMDRAELLSNAPNRSDEAIAVPRVIE